MTPRPAPAFVLDEQLAGDTLVVGDLPLSRVLLMDDARFAWLILVPRLTEVREIFELSVHDQGRLMAEIARCSERLKMLTGAAKINVGALGNLVPQLHVHVVARSAGDVAWPRPAWGYGKRQPYTESDRVTAVARLREALDLP